MTSQVTCETACVYPRTVRSRWVQGGSRLPKLPGTSNLPTDTQHSFNSQNLQFEG